MSVNYRTRLGYGYRVPAEKVRALPAELHDKFLDSRWTIVVNGYDKKADYFFGIQQGFVDPGYMIEVPTRRNYTHRNMVEMVDEYKSYFPNEDNYLCHDWIISGVN